MPTISRGDLSSQLNILDTLIKCYYYYYYYYYLPKLFSVFRVCDIKHGHIRNKRHAMHAEAIMFHKGSFQKILTKLKVADNFRVA